MMGLKLGASSPVDLTLDFGSLHRLYVTWELTIEDVEDNCADLGTVDHIVSLC